MHVLYLHQHFCSPDGASGTRSYEMARRLVQAGHQVTMVCSSANLPGVGGEAPVTRLELDGIRVVALNVAYSNRQSYAQRIRAFARFALGSTRVACAAENVDVVFATSTPLTIAYPGVKAKRRHRCPMVFEVRDLWPELPIAVGALRDPVTKCAARRLERWAYRNAEHVVALSPGMRDGVARTGYPTERITVIPNGSDIGLFRVDAAEGRRFLDAHPYLAGGPLVTYTGVLGPVNGVEFMADIAAAIARIAPDVRFAIIGDGKERERILSHARGLGVLERNLWVLPPVSKTMVPAALAASSIACSFLIDLPALEASCPNKVFDAFAAGKPVLVSYGGWIADLLDESGAGIRVSRTDAEAAASRLSALLSDSGALRRAGQAAAKLADERFDRDLLAGSLRRVLESVVERGS